MRLRKLTDGKQFYICLVKLENNLTCNAIVIFKINSVELSHTWRMIAFISSGGYTF